MSHPTDNLIDGRGAPDAPIAHTPGPWRIGTADDRAVLAGRELVATAFKSGDDPERSSAVGASNARLIAAAPAMLVALRGMVDLVGGSAAYRDGSHSQTVVAIAEGAIALAEGR